jgi:hypothetical protein
MTRPINTATIREEIMASVQYEKKMDRLARLGKLVDQARRAREKREGRTDQRGTKRARTGERLDQHIRDVITSDIGKN